MAEKKPVYLFDAAGVRRIQQMVKANEKRPRVGSQQRRAAPTQGR